MVIVGAGYIACEQACIFNNFGTEVHMLYMEEVALGGELVPQMIIMVSSNQDDDVFALGLMIVKQPQSIHVIRTQDHIS